MKSELGRQKDVSEELLNKANTLNTDIETLRQEGTREDVEQQLEKSRQSFKELKRDIQHYHTQQKTSRKALSRKLQKTLDKIHHIPQENIEKILPSQFQQVREKVKAAQEQFTAQLSAQRESIQGKVSSIHEALVLVEGGSGQGR